MTDALDSLTLDLLTLDKGPNKSRLTVVRVAGRSESILLLQGTTTHAFVNECRHLPIPLAMRAEDCFESTGRYLMCQTHGALFEPQSGLCIQGPCLGRSLRRLPILHESDTTVTVELNGLANPAVRRGIAP